MAQINVQRYLALLERADAGKLAQTLRRPSTEEAAILQEHLGQERFQRMRKMAQAAMARAEAARPRGNVVVIPGLCGSELTAFNPGGSQEPIWPNVRLLAADGLDRLKFYDELTPDPDDEHIESTGILKRYYGVLLLHLAARWNVRSFHYDWRAGLGDTAEKLLAKLKGKEWFPPGEPVHIVAHGRGAWLHGLCGLVIPKLWGPDRRCGRLVLVGTPTRGTYIAVQALAGVAGFVRKLGMLKEEHDRDDLLKIILSFPSLYELLPSPSSGSPPDLLYKASTYTDLDSVDVEVPQRNLDRELEISMTR